ncbi:MAG TPA: UDP-N-acetylmuramate dehydrogenase [Pseudonocardia sp.]|nr:UDP-N-acetylmuramate dehydrogenase [Pseudonocardia sp.]
MSKPAVAGPVPEPAPPSTNVALAPHTTLRLGGPAERLVEATSADEVVAAVRAAEAVGEPVLVLGGGSNLVVADEGVHGTVVRVATSGHHVERRPDGSVRLTVEAGEDWDTLVATTVAEGLGGLECLSGIPGSTGATPVQNVGAYGVEVSDLLVDVDLYDRRAGAVRTHVPAAELGLGYRRSVLKGRDDAIVLRVRLALRGDGVSAPIRYPELARALGVEPGDTVPAPVAREAVLGLRRGKGMVLDAADHDTWSAGSFFTNPFLTPEQAAALPDDAPRWKQPDGRVKSSAAWLIERAGFGKGHGLDVRGGRASLSTKHTLALTNRGGASTEDLLALAREVRDGVEAAYGVRLVNEPVLVGCEL